MQPPGLSDLDQLIAGLEPSLSPGIYVYVGLAAGQHLPAEIRPLLTFAEEEGTTCIITHEAALKHGLPFTYPCRHICLRVRSSLDAVGFMARIATHLAAQEISVNVVSALHHDHLFVPASRSMEALKALQALANGSC